MTGSALADRLLDAHVRLVALRPGVEGGEPWPPSERFGVEPEASWNPPELLAHVAEMLPYWIGQVDRILEGFPEPVSFGRLQADDDRIGAIARDRLLPAADLFDRIASGTETATARLRALGDDQLERRGTHPTLGEMTVRGVIERMLLAHLDGHVEQLTAILARPSGAR
jgi:hypothetical protein